MGTPQAAPVASAAGLPELEGFLRVLIWQLRRGARVEDGLKVANFSVFDF